MKHLYLTFFFFALLCGLPLFGQDTIVVQTFTWDSPTRAGYFEFPDDPTASYRKILMRYNMRCHDAAVGNGNVGCREWDYSCNTFLTDPELTDSVMATHPTHLISNFSGTEFEYTDVPTYTYLQFVQHEAGFSNITSQSNTTIGFASELIGLGEAAVGRQQYLFQGSELANAGMSAGPIYGLTIPILTAGDELKFLRLRIKQTAQSELNPNAPEVDGFTEVYFLNTDPSTGDQEFRFYQPFDWDGASNLLVEFSFTNPNTGLPTYALGSDAGFPAALSSTTPDFSLNFAGSGNIDAPTDAFSGISNEITISLWCFGDAATLPANSTIFEGVDANNQRQANVHLPWGNGQVYWDCGNDGGGYDRINLAANAADYEGRWNHWAFTKNAATGSMKIYLNGQLWHSGSGKTKPIDIQSFRIGSNAGSSNFYYGKVNEFRVWNKELDPATIQEWMYKPLSADHPDYANLTAYYPLNEGIGTITADASPNGAVGTIYSFPTWSPLRGKDLYQAFTASNLRPQVTFIQGEIEISDNEVIVLDSTLNSPHSVISFGVDGTDLVALDTTYVYRAGDLNILDENGAVVGTQFVTPDGAISIGSLSYYQKTDAKFELLSLVTPYGNGLDLGPEGKTFTFDVTDYAPILKGEKYLSIELGGEYQEELDIQFLFITGTPPREVLSIQNIWPFRRGWYADIQAENVFEPRELTLSPDGDRFKVRSSITGHGQNGEFVPRTHYLNLNDAPNEFEYEVWKKCGENPIFPQGGTWLFDRAGWCPGMATDVHELPLDFLANAGETITIDYGVIGPQLNEANYLVSNQLVTYGPANFNRDLAVEAIVKPTLQLEYERFNPICSHPRVAVKNTGALSVNSLKIDYKVRGGSVELTRDYFGQIAPGETKVIELPIDWLGFWLTDEPEYVFEVQVHSPDGATDEYAANDYMSAVFQLPDMYDSDDELVLQLRTNNRPTENYYTITDLEGNVVMSRYQMANSTTYNDEINLPSGCYSLFVEDSGDDGLDYWYWNVVDPSVGSGFIKIQEIVNGIPITVKSFEPEFGGSIRYDFVVGQYTGSSEVEAPRLFTVYPNPAQDEVIVELQGFGASELQLELIDLTGQILLRQTVEQGADHLRLPVALHGIPTGMYQLRVVQESKSWVRPVVKVK